MVGEDAAVVHEAEANAEGRRSGPARYERDFRRAVPRGAGLAVALAALIALLSPALAQAAHITTVTFDELSTQPIDGVSLKGVTFDFKVGGVDSNDATFAEIGPLLNFLDTSVVAGDAAGVLTIDFDSLAKRVEMGGALNWIGPVTAGFTVELFDDTLTSIGSFPVDLTSIVGFSEGLFVYDGSSGFVKRAVATFDTAFGNPDPTFELDNLFFTTPSAAVPGLGAPALALLAATLAGLGLRVGRRSRS